MPTINHGRSVVIHVPSGHVLAIAADANGLGRVGRLADRIGAAVPDVPRTLEDVAAGKILNNGPFAVPTRWQIESVAGTIGFMIDDGHPAEFVP